MTNTSGNTQGNFKITNHVDFDANGRAQCPSCLLAGKTSKNLSLVTSEGAYKCHRGCSRDEIREALGQRKERVVPTAIAAAKNVTVSPQKVKEAHDRLMASDGPAKQWLRDRGITEEMMHRHQLGITRAQVGKKHYPAITIPLPANADGTAYYQKKRIAPWLTIDAPEYKPWSQYGIPNQTFFTWLPSEATETWLCEGEWDAIMLASEMRKADTPIAIATFTGGAGNIPSEDQVALLPGTVTIWYDVNDAPTKTGKIPGDEGAKKAAGKLGDRARIATVPHPEDCPHGWDVSDAINHGLFEQFAAAAAAAKSFTSEPEKPINPLRDRILTNDELMASAPDHIEWLVPDLITEDELFLLAAPPRGGKSLFALTLAKAIASGSKFLDRPVTQGAVLYVNCEDGPAKIKQRQLAQGWSENLPVYWMDKFKLSEMHHLQDLVADIPDLRLIILDTLSRVRDDGNKESSAELSRVMEPIQEFCRDRKIAILITHHTGKTSDSNNGADPFDMIRGSSSIRATVRGALMLFPAENSYRLLSENGHTDRLDLKVRIDSENWEWKLLGRWEPRVDGDMKSRVLDHLNLVGSATVEQIASDLGFRAGSVSTVLYRLQGEDMVIKTGGKGRSPAIYARSANLLQQGDVLLAHGNPDGVSDIALRQQNPESEETQKKVIISSESDHPKSPKDDHFCANTPKQADLLAQGYKSSSASDSKRQQGDSLLAQVGATLPLKVGDRVLYAGTSATMDRLCGMKHLQVERVEDDWAVVRHKDWVVSQTVLIEDLKLVGK